MSIHFSWFRRIPSNFFVFFFCYCSSKGILIFYYYKNSKLKQFTSKLCWLLHQLYCEWSFWFAHFVVHYTITSSSVCIWTMMKPKMLAHFDSTAAAAAATTKHCSERSHVMLFVQCIICLHETIHFRLFNPTLIKYNNGSCDLTWLDLTWLGLSYNVRFYAIFMLQNEMVVTNEKWNVNIYKRPCRCSQNTCSAMVTIPIYPCMPLIRLQSFQFSFIMSHT